MNGKNFFEKGWIPLTNITSAKIVFKPNNRGSELLIAAFQNKKIEEIMDEADFEFYKIKTPKYFNDFKKDEAIHDFFLKYENQSIILPDRFLSSKEFLDWHYINIFKK